jgi:hypothetical protein
MNSHNRRAGKLKFPMKLEKFLRLVLPNVRRPDRHVAWRKFLAHPSSLGQVNGVDFNAVATKFYKIGISGEMTFFTTAIRFGGWFPQWRKEETARQRRAAANWRKRKARPPVHKLKAILRKRHLT